MKQLLFVTVIATMFIGALAMGDVKLNKSHKGMDVDGKKVNCVYCHKDTNIPKKGTDYKKHQSSATCSGSKCHSK
ncbi:MAG: hypothetical protein JXX29_06840 [Deltaproteobacteria bacterium]|nr:hypothetical protein [Deltaproteobacteria bacterium]MBN2671369.1 hypothetical protein [Deltaproteobacteria bacterium]